MPKSKILPSVVLLSAAFSLVFTANLVFAKDDPCDDVEDVDEKAACYDDAIEEYEGKYKSTSKKLDDVRNQKNEVSAKIDALLATLNITQDQINSLQLDINNMVATLETISQNLVEKNGQLQEKIAFRNKIIRNYTKRGVLNDLEMFFAPNSTQNLNGFQFSTFSYMFEKSLNLESVRLLNIINTEITNFENDKKEAQELKQELEVAQANLIAVKNQAAQEKSQVQGDFDDLSSKEGDYEEDLASISERINDLSSKQKAILSAKYGDESGSVGDYEQLSWSVPDPKFSPAFGFFSYGAYTHYRGMSQYGARGRAEDGQDYKDILNFYYKKEPKKKDDFPSKVRVDGFGEIDFQYYLYGLAEMPSDWPMDALKAQAIAGRSYAYRYHKAGKSICTSQSCQVFLKSKADNPPERWRKAVDETKKVIVEDTHAMYSSTAGGYIDDGVGWDKDGSWPNDAYEKKGDSPWFYWPWYSKSYRFDSDTCGRDYPWLNEEEMADILNSWVVLTKGSGSDRDRISPVTTSCWSGNPYSHDKMADRAQDLGGKYTSVSSVSVDIGNDGRTKTIKFSTNRGTVKINGAEFIDVFNLRAPSYVSIKSRLYDVQHEN